MMATVRRFEGGVAVQGSVQSIAGAMLCVMLAGCGIAQRMQAQEQAKQLAAQSDPGLF